MTRQLKAKSWYTTTEARAYLAQRGHDMSEQSLRGHIKNGKLKAELMSAKSWDSVMMRLEALEEFVARETGNSIAS